MFNNLNALTTYKVTARVTNNAGKTTEKPVSFRTLELSEYMNIVEVESYPKTTIAMLSELPAVIHTFFILDLGSPWGLIPSLAMQIHR